MGRLGRLKLGEAVVDGALLASAAAAAAAASLLAFSFRVKGKEKGTLASRSFATSLYGLHDKEPYQET